jgi:NAD+ synthase
MDHSKIIEHIVNWLKNYTKASGTKGFVVGVSGGIDSALTSTLCAMTGERVIVLNMPIRQAASQFSRSAEHITWLKNKFSNVESNTVDLSPVLDTFETALPYGIQDFLTMANTRARIRMSTLYAFAGHHKLVVAGTGNKIEDFGVGFFTKYGDGGVDLSPIADLTKTEVFALARHLGVVESIQTAVPTDGLFGDDKSDEEQLGASYPELEWAMDYVEKGVQSELNDRQKVVLGIYKSRHSANLHKMISVPICIIPPQLK